MLDAGSPCLGNNRIDTAKAPVIQKVLQLKGIQPAHYDSQFPAKRDGFQRKYAKTRSELILSRVCNRHQDH
jgi:hypothetical protein